VYRKGLASSVGQARQFIIHGHISINDRKVTIPGYIVPRGEEDRVALNPRSPITDEMHPVRIAQKASMESRAKKESYPEPRRDDRGDRRGGDKRKFVKKITKTAIPADTGVEADVPIDLPPEGAK
jgi:ribosomal protein S4